jgi:hypothetical protein
MVRQIRLNRRRFGEFSAHCDLQIQLAADEVCHGYSLVGLCPTLKSARFIASNFLIIDGLTSLYLFRLL